MGIAAVNELAIAPAKLTDPFNIAEPDPKKRLGILLAMARISHGLLQKQLARRMEVSWSSVAKWETGHTFTEEMQHRAAIVLGQDLDSFFMSPNIEAPRFCVIETDPYKRLQVIIRMARTSQGFSSADLAEKLSTQICGRIYYQTVNNWETGVRPIDAVMLRQVAIALNQSPELFWS